MKEIDLRTSVELLYIHRYLSLRELERLTISIVSRRTLIRWKQQYKWDEKQKHDKKKKYLGHAFDCIMQLHRSKIQKQTIQKIISGCNSNTF